jgi:hypothetical protein
MIDAVSRPLEVVLVFGEQRVSERDTARIRILMIHFCFDRCIWRATQ